MISTANFTSLPDRHKLQQICKAISVLDAILCQEWVDRYYSYNSKWSDGEEFCGVLNAEGDVLILFRNEGCVINGMAHEYYPKDKANLTKGLPTIYHDFIFGEPVHSIGTTFCLWTASDGKWEVGEVTDYNDGSEDLLTIFEGDPQAYIDWAKEYYEDGFMVDKNTYQLVLDIYQGRPLTKETVLSMVNKMEDWEQLKMDLEEIDYPYNFS